MKKLLNAARVLVVTMILMLMAALSGCTDKEAKDETTYEKVIESQDDEPTEFTMEEEAN